MLLLFFTLLWGVASQGELFCTISLEKSYIGDGSCTATPSQHNFGCTLNNRANVYLHFSDGLENGAYISFFDCLEGTDCNWVNFALSSNQTNIGDGYTAKGIFETYSDSLDREFSASFNFTAKTAGSQVCRDDANDDPSACCFVGTDETQCSLFSSSESLEVSLTNAGCPSGKYVQEYVQDYSSVYPLYAMCMQLYATGPDNLFHAWCLGQAKTNFFLNFQVECSIAGDHLTPLPLNGKSAAPDRSQVEASSLPFPK